MRLLDFFIKEPKKTFASFDQSQCFFSLERAIKTEEIKLSQFLAY